MNQQNKQTKWVIEDEIGKLLVSRDDLIDECQITMCKTRLLDLEIATLRDKLKVIRLMQTL